MKKVCFLVLLGFCLCSVTNAQAEVQFLEKVCLNLVSASTASETLQLEILSYGTDTFPIYGKISSGGGALVPLHGTAVVNGNIVTMTLNASSLTWGPLTATYSLSIDLQLLSGTFRALTQTLPDILPNPSEPPLTILSGGTVTLQACP